MSSRVHQECHRLCQQPSPLSVLFHFNSSNSKAHFTSEGQAQMSKYWAVITSCCVILALVPSSSVASLRLGDTGDVSASLWPFHNDGNVPDGISFERTETHYSLIPSWWDLPSRLSNIFASYMLYPLPRRFQVSPQTVPSATFDSDHCKSTDAFGSNNCNYRWGDDITIQYDGNIAQDMNGNVWYLEVVAKVRYLKFIRRYDHIHAVDILMDYPRYNTFVD